MCIDTVVTKDGHVGRFCNLPFSIHSSYHVWVRVAFTGESMMYDSLSDKTSCAPDIEIYA